MKWQNVRKMWTDPRSCCWCPDSSALILRTSEAVWNSFHLLLTSRSHTWIHPKQKHRYVPTRLCPGGRRRGRQGERDVMHRAHQNIRTRRVTKVHLCNFNFLQFLFGCRERCWGRAGGHVSQVSLETDVVLGGRQTDTIRVIAQLKNICQLAVVREGLYSLRPYRTLRPWCDRFQTLFSVWHALLHTPFSASPVGAIMDRRVKWIHKQVLFVVLDIRMCVFILHDALNLEMAGKCKI